MYNVLYIIRKKNNSLNREETIIPQRISFLQDGEQGYRKEEYINILGEEVDLIS